MFTYTVQRVQAYPSHATGEPVSTINARVGDRCNKRHNLETGSKAHVVSQIRHHSNTQGLYGKIIQLIGFITDAP